MAKDVGKKFWAKEKWWGLLFAVLIPVINNVMGWGFEAVEVAAVVIPFIAMIVGDIWEEKIEKLIQLEEIRLKKMQKAA